MALQGLPNPEYGPSARKPKPHTLRDRPLLAGGEGGGFGDHHSLDLG